MCKQATYQVNKQVRIRRLKPYLFQHRFSALRYLSPRLDRYTGVPLHGRNDQGKWRASSCGYGLDGTPASWLGLAAGPKQDPRCVRPAFAGGINCFFFYGPGNTSFIEELAALVRRKREQIIVATGSGSRRVEVILTSTVMLATTRRTSR